MTESLLYELERAIEICKIIYKSAEARKGMQPIILDISEFDSICSIMMIVSFSTAAHARSFAAEIERELETEDYYAEYVEGSKTTGWFLLDYGELFVHIMDQEHRDHYQLEEIWRKARKIDLEDCFRNNK